MPRRMVFLDIRKAWLTIVMPPRPSWSASRAAQSLRSRSFNDELML
ncbi:MAG: hypothetical protein JSS02_02000 [Planctomycetes bacterium]|nr:hypothetical protein [Planctomycetota bacterium]